MDLKKIKVTVTQEDWDTAERLRAAYKGNPLSSYRISQQCPLGLATLRAVGLSEFPHPDDGTASILCTLWGQNYSVSKTLSVVPIRFDGIQKEPLTFPVIGTLWLSKKEV